MGSSSEALAQAKQRTQREQMKAAVIEFGTAKIAEITAKIKEVHDKLIAEFLLEPTDKLNDEVFVAQKVNEIVGESVRTAVEHCFKPEETGATLEANYTLSVSDVEFAAQSANTIIEKTLKNVCEEYLKKP